MKKKIFDKREILRVSKSTDWVNNEMIKKILTGDYAFLEICINRENDKDIENLDKLIDQFNAEKIGNVLGKFGYYLVKKDMLSVFFEETKRRDQEGFDNEEHLENIIGIILKKDNITDKFEVTTFELGDNEELNFKNVERLFYQVYLRGSDVRKLLEDGAKKEIVKVLMKGL